MHSLKFKASPTVFSLGENIKIKKENINNWGSDQFYAVSYRGKTIPGIKSFQIKLSDPLPFSADGNPTNNSFCQIISHQYDKDLADFVLELGSFGIGAEVYRPGLGKVLEVYVKDGMVHANGLMLQERIEDIKEEQNQVISMIVAADQNNIIGDGSKIPWKLSSDLKYFKSKTLNHTLIMGRKTFEAIGKPLSQRNTLVMSRKSLDKNYSNCYRVKDIEEALLEAPYDEEIFVCGGGEIYRQFLDITDVIYFTRVNAEVKGDISFPSLKSNWILLSEETPEQTEKDEYSFTFQTYVNKKTFEARFGGSFEHSHIHDFIQNAIRNNSTSKKE